MQVNTSSVESNFWGGDHGYLGLVLDDASYAQIPGTVPFLAPTYSGNLTIHTMNANANI